MLLPLHLSLDKKTINEVTFFKSFIIFELNVYQLFCLNLDL